MRVDSVQGGIYNSLFIQPSSIYGPVDITDDHTGGSSLVYRGYIPDISPRGCGGLAESRTDLQKTNNHIKKPPCILLSAFMVKGHGCRLEGVGE